MREINLITVAAKKAEKRCKSRRNLVSAFKTLLHTDQHQCGANY